MSIKKITLTNLQTPIIRLKLEIYVKKHLNYIFLKSQFQGI